MLRTGETFAGYVIKRVLGQGGMGTVYLAQHPRLPRLTALKLLERDLYSDVEIRSRFEREADLVARLDHPNIVTVYDRGAEDEQLWISMQFVAGSDAASVDVNVMAPWRAVQIIGETAAALDFAHANGVLHRDVKPANILLAKAPIGQPERVLLTDFGIAGMRDSDTTLGSAGTITATLAYASPEQLSGASLDHRCDQYSLACTLFWMLAGTAPFQGASPAAVMNGHLYGQVPPLRPLRAGIPPAFDAVLAKALAKRPDDRFASCSEFAAAARRALVPPGQQRPPTGPRPVSQTGHPQAGPYPTQHGGFPHTGYPHGPQGGPPVDPRSSRPRHPMQPSAPTAHGEPPRPPVRPRPGPPHQGPVPPRPPHTSGTNHGVVPPQPGPGYASGPAHETVGPPPGPYRSGSAHNLVPPRPPGPPHQGGPGQPGPPRPARGQDSPAHRPGQPPSAPRAPRVDPTSHAPVDPHRPARPGENASRSPRSAENGSRSAQPGESASRLPQSGESPHRPAQSGDGAHRPTQTGENAHRAAPSSENAPRPAQAGGNADRAVRAGTDAPRSGQAGDNAHRPGQSGGNAPRRAQAGEGAGKKRPVKPITIALPEARVRRVPPPSANGPDGRPSSDPRPPP